MGGTPMNDVVTKLMGLDLMPAQPSSSTSNGSLKEGYLHNSPAIEQRETRFHGIRPYEELRKPPRKERIKVLLPNNGKSIESSEEKKMAIHKSFAGVGQLATEANLLRSKEYRDAIDILSLNQDLFLKFIKERNSVLSKNLNPPSSSQRITVLKPSKARSLQGPKPMKPKNYQAGEELKKDSKKFNFLSQPTRIVVLKPGPGKPHNTKATSSPLLMEKATGSTEIARKITREVWGSPRNRRDDALLLPKITNEYAGDLSSFDELNNVYREEESFDFRDSMMVSPIYQHSSNYVTDRNGSSDMMSSFGRGALYLSESSVIREAKQRLSKRCAMVSSHGFGQEAKKVGKITTLGKMLTYKDVNFVEKGVRDRNSSSSRSCGGEGDPNTSIASFNLSNAKGENDDNSPRSLSRSKSVPVSSSGYENINTEVPESSTRKPITQKEVPKSRISKSSFRERLSTLFSFKSKKTKSIPPSPLTGACVTQEFMVNGYGKLKNLEVVSSNKSPRVSLPDAAIHPNIPPECPLSFEKASAFQRMIDKQEQPSPVSVLEEHFNDHSNIISPKSSSSSSVHLQTLSSCPTMESLSCPSLSPNVNNLRISLINTPKHPLQLFKAEETLEWLSFAGNLLASASLEIETPTMAFSRWYSPECPLDPALLVEALNLEQDAAKLSKRRSNLRLVFDCINSVILDMGRKAILVFHHRESLSQNSKKVLELLEDWFSGDVDEANDGNAAVDRAVSAEAAGDEWTKSICMEADEIYGHIRSKVLDDLIEEALEFLLSGSCLSCNHQFL